MRRCLETREIVAPDVPFAIDAALHEVDFGSWEGKTLEWLERHEPELVSRRRQNPVAFRPPGGESFDDISSRLRPLAARIRNESTLVISHRGTLGVLERLLRGLPLQSQIVRPLEPSEFHVID